MKKSLRIRLLVSTQYTNATYTQTDVRTDGRTPHDGISCVQKGYHFLAFVWENRQNCKNWRTLAHVALKPNVVQNNFTELGNSLVLVLRVTTWSDQISMHSAVRLSGCVAARCLDLWHLKFWCLGSNFRKSLPGPCDRTRITCRAGPTLVKIGRRKVDEISSGIAYHKKTTAAHRTPASPHFAPPPTWLIALKIF